MVTGLRCGDETCRSRDTVLSAFLDDEGGFTTVAVAVALLLSLTLVFAAASAGWVSSRSAEVQHVADAAAMAGSNAVAGFSTIVQVIDACSLSLGLTGVVVLGAGLVASCVPGLGALGASLCQAGDRVLSARRSFVSSAASGVRRLETALPLIVVANSASCVAANSEDGLAYAGCAVPVPVRSGSDLSALSREVGDEGMGELSERMRDAAAEAEEARERMDDALERGWYADCGSAPYCLWERAGTLAGLSGAANPHHPTPDTWGFGVALTRARDYYAARLAGAGVWGGNAEQLTDAACRRAFYEFALSEVNAGRWIEREDKTIDAHLPMMPRNAEETRATVLYTQQVWPCTVEDGARTLHAASSCPGARGAASGTASLEQVDTGAVGRCDVCRMDVVDMGRVASASSSIDNGFEYHWRIIVEASEDYVVARDDWVAAEARLKALAKEGEQAFDSALDQLSDGGPELLPPGAWGCVSVVARTEGSVVPTELTRSFLESASVPAGAAVSAATLAPDNDTAQNNVLASFFDALGASDSALGGSLDGVMELWGSLLVGYGAAFGDISGAGGDYLDDMDGVMGGTTGSWLRDQLKDLLASAGLEPVDMRLRKPVLVSTGEVLEQGGYERLSTVREFVGRLPDATSPYEFARSVGVELAGATGGSTLTVAELEVPGSGVTIPLTIDLSMLAGAA